LRKKKGKKMSSKTNDFKGTIKSHYIDSTPWWPEKSKAPEGAPNILYILLDDTGYADIGCYGSLVDTPNIDQLANDGLRYRDFHVNAMCSPTRASLLSGCNHHSAGMGYLGNFDLGFPSLRGRVDPQCGLISETLKENGYHTFALGKWHLVNDSDCTGAGPFDHWPLNRGFDKFYGFLGAATNQYYPSLVRGNELVDQPRLPDEGYHISEDITDKAIDYIGDLKSNDPEKPFFCYLSFGAQHSPHQAPKAYIDRYKGVFDEGWDVYRKKVFEKQKALNLIPENAVLTGNDRFGRDWDSFTDSEKRVLDRYMEVYAGFLTHTDTQIGRVIDYLKRIGQYNNTLIVFLTDNGASAEGTPWGIKNAMYHFWTEKFPDPIPEDELEGLGSEHAFCHYPTGWAHASNTPLKLYKSWNHCGGIKVPLIITYPEQIKDKGGIRSQYHHVVDIYKTVLDACNLGEPEAIKGIPQVAKHGVSMVYSFDGPNEKSHKTVQYYEMLGNRGIWSDGWKAVCDHTKNPTFDFERDVWELYHTDSDFCESTDLADKEPVKLRELIECWWHEAGKYGVLPMLESHMKKQEGFHSKTIFKFPPANTESKRIIYPEYSGGLGVRLFQKSGKLTVFANYKTGDEGVLVAGGDNQGGFALYIQDKRLKFHDNWLGLSHASIESDRELPEGALELSLEYSVSGSESSEVRLFINDEPSGILTIDGIMSYVNNFVLGRFPRIPVTDEMREKLHYNYTNHIDRMELLAMPLDDMDKAKALEKEQRLE
jgi:arylsulfatase